jgi:hypothetical protein
MKGKSKPLPGSDGAAFPQRPVLAIDSSDV